MAVFNYKNVEIEYTTLGNGSILVLGFHGFGLDAHAFDVFEPAFKDQFTVYSFSLLYHGNTITPDNFPKDFILKPNELRDFVIAFTESMNIEQFGVLGYSIGGKIALKTIEVIPERINLALLIAPDGLKRNFWYHFATHNAIGKLFFRFFIWFPQPIIMLIGMLSSIRVLPKNMKKFLLSNFQEKENRIKVLNVWRTFSGADPNMDIVLENIEKFNISTHILMGTYDPVLKSSSLQKVIANKKDKISWYNVQGGHNLLKPSLLSTISSIIERMLEKIK